MTKLPYLYVTAGYDRTKGLVYNNLATARVKLLFFWGGVVIPSLPVFKKLGRQLTISCSAEARGSRSTLLSDCLMSVVSPEDVRSCQVVDECCGVIVVSLDEFLILLPHDTDKRST